MQVSCIWLMVAFLLVPLIGSGQSLVIVRHAEKLEPWPYEDRLQPLSLEGTERAKTLDALFVETRFAAIYASNTTRAIATAHPASVSHGVEIRIHPAPSNADSLDAFLREIETGFDASDAILVVSHSNVIPKWLSAFGVDASALTEMGISFDARHNGYLVQGYDGMWVVSLTRAGGPPYVRFARMAAY